MKKIVLTLLSLVFVLSMGAFCFTSCESESKSIVNTYVNENGELIVEYSDETTQNLGVVKGSDGKDGKDGEAGEDLTRCEHTYGEWRTEIEATCSAMGYAVRECSLCKEKDYSFTEALGHSYGRAEDIIYSPCEQRVINETCTICKETKLTEIDPHDYDENGYCLDCSACSEFIESEEYIERDSGRWGVLWWNKDRTYALELSTIYGGFLGQLSDNSGYNVMGYAGTPVDVIIPREFRGLPIKRIGSSMGDIAWNAFENCTTLKSVVLPDTITYIETRAFENCTALTDINIPSSVTEMGGEIFYNCVALTKITIPDSVTFMGIGAFSGCTLLTEINLSNNTRSIGYSTFYNCTSLTEINIPENVTSIRRRAFRNCVSLMEIIIPNTVTEIEIETFLDCPSLTHIYYTGTIEDWNNIEIYSMDDIGVTEEMIYYYCDTEPQTEGNYWRYVDGEPVVWEE